MTQPPKASKSADMGFKRITREDIALAITTTKSKYPEGTILVMNGLGKKTVILPDGSTKRYEESRS